MMERPKSEGRGAGEVGTCSDARLMKLCPTVVQWMTDGVWADGAAREVSSLSITVDEGRIKLAFNDRDGHRTAYLSADSLEDALKVLERQLTTGQADWRSWNARTKRK